MLPRAVGRGFDSSTVLGVVLGEFRLLGGRGFGLVPGLPLGVGHAVDDLPGLLVREVKAALLGRRADHF